MEELSASASRAQASGPTGVRPGCLVAGGLVVLGAVLALLVSLVLMRGGGDIDLGLASGYAPGTVVYRSTDGLFVVRPKEGDVLALSDLDPHNPVGRSSCRVTFRPDLAADGQPGRFFDGCTGATYDLDGRALNGDGRNLQRLPVQVDKDGRLSVQKPAQPD